MPLAVVVSCQCERSPIQQSMQKVSRVIGVDNCNPTRPKCQSSKSQRIAGYKLIETARMRAMDAGLVRNKIFGGMLYIARFER